VSKSVLAVLCLFALVGCAVIPSGMSNLESAVENAGYSITGMFLGSDSFDFVQAREESQEDEHLPGIDVGADRSFVLPGVEQEVQCADMRAELAGSTAVVDRSHAAVRVSAAATRTRP
jgi:hypothetical protein